MSGLPEILKDYPLNLLVLFVPWLIGVAVIIGFLRRRVERWWRIYHRPMIAYLDENGERRLAEIEALASIEARGYTIKRIGRVKSTMRGRFWNG